MNATPVIVVHGGAGAWEEAPGRLKEGRRACEDAARAAQAVLLGGGSALDAVEVAVRVLEDCPALDAGRGSYPNASGEIEMDAMIMDGSTLSVGAVAAISRVRYPVSLARELLSVDDTNLLVAYGASLFADRIGFPRCEHEDLLVEERWDGHSPHASTSDTVGAVARDALGNLAAATSTGGTRAKLPGRVGDSPLAGSGAYADNLSAAVSATGRGEDLMKILISKQVADFAAAGLPAQEACSAAIRYLISRVNGSGGVIAIDAKSHVGVAYNTSAMPFAHVTGSGKLFSGI
ncbi:MAG: isoaspartyl peptidase/L-asparaginase family protein [Candidatus Promineifilaceae bacterium]